MCNTQTYNVRYKKAVRDTWTLIAKEIEATSVSDALDKAVVADNLMLDTSLWFSVETTGSPKTAVVHKGRISVAPTGVELI